MGSTKTENESNTLSGSTLHSLQVKKKYLILARIKFYPEIYSKKCNHTHLRNIVRNIRERETFCCANKQHMYMTEVGGNLPEIPAIITVKEKLFQGGFPLRFPPSCQIL